MLILVAKRDQEKQYNSAQQPKGKSMAGTSRGNKNTVFASIRENVIVAVVGASINILRVRINSHDYCC